jgi:hypothetical protein
LGLILRGKELDVKTNEISGAAPILATCMDLVGVTVACVVCNAMLFEVETLNEGSRQNFAV